MATGPVSLCERRLPEGEGNNKSTKRPTASSIFTGGTPQRLGYNLSSLGPTRFRIRKTHGSTMARAHAMHSLTVEEPSDVGGGCPFGLAWYRRVFPVERGHVSRRVDQHGRRGCNGKRCLRTVSSTEPHILRSAPLLHCNDDFFHPRDNFLPQLGIKRIKPTFSMGRRGSVT